MMLRRRMNRRRAVILVLVLWISVVLGLMAYSVTYQIILETKVTSLRRKTVQARALARAGVARAFTDLRNDILFDFTEDDGPAEPFDSEGDVWAGPEYDNEKGMEIDDDLPGRYFIQVRDENALLNLNSMTSANKQVLQAIAEMIGYEEDDAKLVAAAIVDWADADDTPALDTSEGVEGFAYGKLKAEDEGLSVRDKDIERLNFPNEPYLTVESLLDVYGVTPELYFGPGTPEAEYWREQIGAPQGKQFEMARRRRRRDETPLGLRDFFTVHGQGQINANTAPPHVLEALLTAGGVQDAENVAERIVRERRGGGGSRIKSDDAFKNETDLQTGPYLGPHYGAVSALYPMGVRSEIFTITATGVVDTTRQTLQVTVRRSLDMLRRDESFEAIDRAEDRLERYEDDGRRRRDREDENLIRLPAIRIIQWTKE